VSSERDMTEPRNRGPRMGYPSTRLRSVAILLATVTAAPVHAQARVRTHSGVDEGTVMPDYFDRRTPESPDGANHAADLSYVFGTLGSRGIRARAEDRALSDLMQAYWINFARSGNPNGSGLPAWPEFTTADPLVMELDATPGARLVPNLEQLRALDAYFAWRREQANERR
jgi:para-nitrobenzyl esterase